MVMVTYGNVGDGECEQIVIRGYLQLLVGNDGQDDEGVAQDVHQEEQRHGRGKPCLDRQWENRAAPVHGWSGDWVSDTLLVRGVGQ